MEISSLKDRLVDELRTTRQAWEAVISKASASLLVQPATLGTWAIKDVIVHCTLYAAWFVRAMQADLLGEPPTLDGTETIPQDERNAMHYLQSRKMSAVESLASWRSTFEQLIAVVEAHPASFFSEPQRFVGVPDTVDVGGQIHHLSEHYQAHLREIVEYITKAQGK